MNKTHERIVERAMAVGLGVDIRIASGSNRTRVFSFIRRLDGMCVGVVRRAADARCFLDGYIAGNKYPQFTRLETV